jgi:hypothetical protein
MPDRDSVNLFHAHGGHETILRARRSHFRALRRRPETTIRYQRSRSTNEDLVMWNIIISLFYRQSCKKHLTDMRKHRWNIATAG